MTTEKVACAWLLLGNTDGCGIKGDQGDRLCEEKVRVKPDGDPAAGDEMAQTNRIHGDDDLFRLQTGSACFRLYPSARSCWASISEMT